MKSQCFCSVLIAGLSITQFGMEIPSPFCSLTLNNTETDNYTNWELTVTVGGDASRKVNIGAFEALIYSAAQTDGYANASGVPVTFMFGWLNDQGGVDSYLSYKGWTLKYQASMSSMFMTYKLTGYASQVMSLAPAYFNIPALSGMVQPSAVVEALAIALRVTDYYELDIDHCDAPTYVNHNAMTTSFTTYIRGDQNGVDDYANFSGLLPLSKNYNASRDAAGLKSGSGKLSTLLNNLSQSSINNYLKASLTDKTPQGSSFSYWTDEPTMVKSGVLHYKCTSSLQATQDTEVLKYGTPDTNILSISGNYDGVAYNMTNMAFSTLGFTLGAEGEQISLDGTVVNSWSADLPNVFQTANMINNINALASQFSGDFTVTIPGSVRGYTICMPVSLVIMSGNTLSPASGIYNIKSISHQISSTFVTTMKLQRLAISYANQVATSAGIKVDGSDVIMNRSSYTKNIISTGKVDFGKLYPTWVDVQSANMAM